MARRRVGICVWECLSQGHGVRQILPGIMVIGLVVLARALGLFQELEWRALDGFLRLRPAEPPDERVLIVGINEADIQALGTYPVPDRDLAALLQALSAHSPRAIGVDIFRDLPVEPGHEVLQETFARTPEIIGIEKIYSSLLPPPSLPPEQVGFIDFPLDQDGFVRRAYLGSWPPETHPEPKRFRFSLPLVLARRYLAAEGLEIANGIRDRDNMRFDTTELPRFQPHSGSYINADAAGIQLLIHPRSGRLPFRQVSMMEVLEGQVNPDWIRDRVVLVGITSLSTKDIVSSAAVNAQNPGLVYGIEMHAHVVSQLLSAVLNDRPLLQVWNDGWEYLWIIFWGSAGMMLVRVIRRPAWYMLVIGLTGLGLVGACLLLLWLGGWWIPIVPTLIGFMLNGWILPGFYLYDQTLRSRIAERQRVIEETYDTIHNGPLQTLALLLKQREQLDPDVSSQLTDLNRELREVYNRLQQESLPPEEQLQLGGQRIVDLRNPLHEVLYEVYAETLRRDFPGFDSIKFQVVKFEPLQVAGLSTDDRRSLCRFLEEMLCNVGKHAVNPKRLTVICGTTATENLIRVEDNGKGNDSPLPAPPANLQTGGRGTQQATALAKRLHGTFARSRQETGTHCELRWPLRVPNAWWHYFRAGS